MFPAKNAKAFQKHWSDFLQIGFIRTRLIDRFFAILSIPKSWKDAVLCQVATELHTC